MTTFAIVTFGCRVNQADSLRIERDLLARGAAPAAVDDADLVVVNTCSVTASADQGARQTIRRVTRSHPDVRVVVTGCYATRRPGELAALPNVVQVVANGDKDDLVDRIAVTVGLTSAERFGDGDGACGAMLSPGAAGRTALTLRVQTGCDQTCSYCIIPSTRGTGRSRPLAEVRREIEIATAAGYREIAITGVHLGSYGRDLPARESLTALVHMLAAWPQDVLFRVSSLEPMDCTPAIVDAVASSPRLAPHFHLPLQHGCDAVLERMRRPYTAAHYQRLIATIYERMPHAAIGTDLIVGFPGETEAEFERACALVEQLPLSHLHVFPYSDRPGTAASLLSAKIDGAIIRARGARLRAIGEQKARAFRQGQMAAVRRALVVDEGWSGVTDNYLKVRLDRQLTRNTWATVRIDGVEPLRAVVT